VRADQQAELDAAREAVVEALDRLNSSADSMARELNWLLGVTGHHRHGECQCRICQQVVPEAVEALADAQEALSAIRAVPRRGTQTVMAGVRCGRAKPAPVEEQNA